MIYSYRRVSTDEQHNGPQAQTDAINRWINAQSRDLGCWNDFFDNGVSGSIPLFERPAGSKLGERIEQDKEPPTIVVAKLDRLFRSVADAATVLDHWGKIGVKLVSISEGFDMTSPYGRAMAQMASVFAELERVMIRDRTQAALDAKRLRGECIGGLPYGWRLDNDGTHILPDDSEQGWICNMRKFREQDGWSYDKIADYMNTAGIPTKTRAGKWHSVQIGRILRREHKHVTASVSNVS